MKILIVDDSAFMRTIVKNALKGVECKISEAKNGKEAVEQHATEMPDITIMDILMPEMDGIEALRRIKSASPASIVIMCTSVGGQEDYSKEAIALGANEIIRKPFKTEDLQRVVAYFSKKGA